MTSGSIHTLFLDIGGVLLTNGWDRQARQLAVEIFHLDYQEMDERHHLIFDTFESGKISLDEYLERVVFYQSRPFSRDDFKAFVFSRSQPYQDMLDLVRGLKRKYGLKIVAVSNEGYELAQYRIQKFHLKDIFDAFIISCFAHFRKPDLDIFRLAQAVVQAEPSETVFIDDRFMFVQVAESLGLHGIHHVSTEETKDKLAEFGLI
jgi:putative hydrolase of the HAD superfamily